MLRDADLPRSPTWSCDAATCLLKLPATAAAGQGSSQKRSLNLKPKQIGAPVEGWPKASFVFEKVFDILVVVCPTLGGLKRGVMQQSRAPRCCSFQLAPFQTLPSSTLLFKFALFSLKNIICRNQNFGKFYLSAKGEKQPKECCRPLPPHHLLFSTLASDSRAETCFFVRLP